MPPKTSGKAAAKSGKATKKIAKGDKKKRKGKRKESYAMYIYKLSWCFKCFSCNSFSFRCWSRCTPTPVSPPRPCPSWTRSRTTSSRGSPPRPASSPTTTRGELLLVLSRVLTLPSPKIHDHLPGDPDRRAPDAARGARHSFYFSLSLFSFPPSIYLSFYLPFFISLSFSLSSLYHSLWRI